MIRFLSCAAMAVATVAALSVPAFAHVTLEVQQANIGSTYKAVVRVPHGCGTEATNVVRIQIPEGFFAVKPMPKAGWDLEVVTGPYKNAYDNHGAAVTEGVTEIVWSGGDLPDAFYDEFVFRGTFAASLAPGKFYFPTIQECASAEEAWIDVTGSDAADMPAPSLELVPAKGAGH
ncbi:DUF1775 domain-containing protein [Devosia sp. 2618]|uniref:YcnI family copper-binding membrane protein n=1 Tax=Devosia sp. 2618 TaxID=3156454 RepID=UPI00339669D0